MIGEAEYDSVVLAGERAGRTPLAVMADVAADVLVPVAGKPAVEWVLSALRDANAVRPAVLVGPDRDVLAGCADVRELLARYGVRWLEPQADPASSAITAIDQLVPPILLTSGDHALLTAGVIDRFCRDAYRASADLVVGLVPYDLVREAYPESRRTVLRFADGRYCGANLFFARNPVSRSAFEFWRGVQHDRKRPWRIARRIGVTFMLRYLMGRLTLSSALEVLSNLAGCRVAVVHVRDPRAAVDVDSVDDWHLAQRILAGSA